MNELRDNTGASQYEVDENGHTSFARYRREGDVLTILWVESPPELRGTGAAGRLMTKVAEEARKNSWRVVPVCGYAAGWLRGSKQYRDLVA